MVDVRESKCEDEEDENKSEMRGVVDSWQVDEKVRHVCTTANRQTNR